MTRTIYFDCFSGISGDMCLGALISAGADFSKVQTGLDMLGIPGLGLEVATIKVNGIGVVDVTVKFPQENQPHRHLSDIKLLIESSGLSTKVKSQSMQVFQRLAEAEAKVHQTTVEKVHFHEVGALDSLADIIGSVIALDILNVERLTVGQLPSGKGFIECAHGLLPIPVPAVVELLRGYVIHDNGVEGELVTPTGAAILAALAEPVDGIPSMTLETVGYGAGKRKYDKPNLLRVIIGTSS
ncbi:nickel pincer cofactor biosynthesis protein LarC [Desulfosporosinus fructosivorans]